MTTLLNLETVQNEYKVLKFCESQDVFLPDGDTFCKIEFPHNGWVERDNHTCAEMRDGATWSAGLDISLSRRQRVDNRWSGYYLLGKVAPI